MSQGLLSGSGRTAVSRTLASAPAALLLAALLAGLPALAHADLIPLAGQVYLDVNGDGLRQPESEPGLADVGVTNGEQVLVTGADGGFSTTVDLGRSHFLWITVPTGYRATTTFYYRVPSTPPPDSLLFGLAREPAYDPGPFTFVQSTDPEVASAVKAANLATDVAEAAGADPAPLFMVCTGDLVVNGDRTYLGNVRQIFANAPIPVYPLYGNHDAVPGDPYPTRAYEDSLGPTYYSFERCGCRFVMLNSIDPPAAQQNWLAADLAHATPGARIIMLRHSPPTHTELDQYLAEGVALMLTGHWHGDRVTNYRGLLNVTTPPFCFAGMDRTPRGFRLIHVTDSDIRTEYRWGGQPHRLAVVFPPEFGVARGSLVRVRVNAYDTAVPVEAVTVVLSGPAGPLAPIELHRDSEWSWSGDWEPGDAPRGAYTLQATVQDVRGNSWATTSHFSLAGGSGPVAVSGTDWPLLRGNAQRTGAATDSISPPLALVWAAPAGGLTGLASPVVWHGTVFLGTGAASDRDTAGVSAFDAATGGLLWRTGTSSAVTGTVAASALGIYAVTVNGELVRFVPGTGARLWTSELGDTTSRFETSSPAIESGIVFAGRAALITARLAATGYPLWTAPPQGSDFIPNDHPAPALLDDLHFTGTGSGFFAMDRTSGAIRWNLNGYYRGPAAKDGVVYGVGGTAFASQQLFARDAVSGGVSWTSPVDLLNGSSSPAVSGGRVIVGTGDGLVRSFDAASGGTQWTFTSGTGIASTRPYAREGGDVCSSPAISGNTVYVGANDGYLYALDLATGVVRWRFYLGVPVRSSPAVSGNAVYVAADDGMLYAFAPATSAADVPEPEGSGAFGADGGREALTLRIPSPLRAGDRMELAASRPADGELALVDVRGRVVRQLDAGRVGPEGLTLTWDGRDAGGRRLAPGIYFAVFRAGEATLRTKVAIVH